MAWPSLGAQCATPCQVGARVEGEWLPGSWEWGYVRAVAADGTYSVEYDDGYMQHSVARERLRMSQTHSVAQIAGSETKGHSTGSRSLPPAGAPMKVQFKAGDTVEYHSVSLGQWILARVVRVNASDETYDLDCKVGVAPDRVRAAAAGVHSPEHHQGEMVEYYSDSLGRWVLAQVKHMNADGTYDLDCKAGALSSKVRKLRAPTTPAADIASAPTPSARNVAGLVVAPVVIPEAANGSQGYCPSARGPPSPAMGTVSASARTESCNANASNERIAGSLREAMAGQDQAALLNAMEAAYSARLCDDELHAAHDALRSAEESELKVRARELIDSAEGEEANTSAGAQRQWWRLQTAMQRAAAAGLGTNDMDRIRTAMQNLKKRQKELAYAEKTLRDAYSSDSVDVIQKAIQLAESVQLPADQLRPAKEKLSTMQKKDKARKLLKSAMANRIVASLQEAVKAGESAGLEAEEMQVAQRMLSECLLEEARQALRKAERVQDPEQLSAAIQDARSAGVCAAELKRSVEVLRVLEVQREEMCRLTEARKGVELELQEATAAEDIQRMERALQTAASLALQSPNVEATRQALRSVQARAATMAEAHHRLEHATARGDINDLRAAIDAAQRLRIQDSKIQGARRKLLDLEKQDQARSVLRSATASKDPTQLRAAVASARAAGLSDIEVQPATAQLHVLENIERIHRELVDATRGQDGARLQSAIFAAEAMGLAGTEIREAKQRFNALMRTQLIQNVQDAIGSHDIGKIRRALEAATDAGLSTAETDSARKALRELEAGEWCRKELRTAMQGADTVKLQTAIDMVSQEVTRRGRSAGVDEELRAARAMLEKLKVERLQNQQGQWASAAGQSVRMPTGQLAYGADGELRPALPHASCSLTPYGAGSSKPPTGQFRYNARGELVQN